MDKTKAKVSVIMSVYEVSPYLKISVESILNQTFKDFEFIVVDDGSTDYTLNILRSYQEKDDRIKVIVNEKNMGLTKSLNKAIKIAKGAYIARIDADDASLPGRLEKQVDFLDDNVEVGMAGTAYHEIDSDGRIIGGKVFPALDHEIKKALIKYNPFFHGSVMIRKIAFEKVGLYDEAFHWAQDYELWFRMAKYFKLANLPEFLNMRRYYNTNISFALEQEQIRFALRARLKAIKEKQYPVYCYVYLLRPFIAMKTPDPTKKLIRKYILKSKRW